MLDGLGAWTGDPSHLDHGEASRPERPRVPLHGLCGLLQPCPVPALPAWPPHGSSPSPHPRLPKELF
ncbi:hypothetical protein J116_025715 [Streptomyces thermolilacinus SPC6]|uniref:Uncharacterized protein n=1 Tax=Streptomyces thermolilacinus SPC6 TaxID=1306406 RepID=A0A1D3DYF5_9ACTN|nr:hypothetical protein J116_025715 [Streptomyces thermolilacinus SPC6]